MANNTQGTGIKDSTCPEEQTAHKSDTAQISPVERPKGGGGWHCSVPGMHNICLKTLINMMSVGLQESQGGWREETWSQGHREGIHTHLPHFPEKWL